MKKKLMLAIGAMGMIAAVAVGATLAYYTSDTTGVNVISIGNINISARLGDGGATTTVTPGIPFDVTGVVITNDGKNPAYIRIQLRPALASYRQYYAGLSLTGAELVTSAGYNGDWYYYKLALEPGKRVELDGLATLKEGVKKADMPAGVKLQYFVEAIQTDQIAISSSGYPIWPDVEIKEYRG